jgi:hypothetical protein
MGKKHEKQRKLEVIMMSAKRYLNIIWDCSQCGLRNWNKSYSGIDGSRYPCDFCGSHCRLGKKTYVRVTEDFGKAKEVYRLGKFQK